MESQHLIALRVIAAVAWGDGVLAREEADLLRGLIGACGELTDRERTTARRFLEQPVELDAGALRSLPLEARRAIYGQAAQCAAADHELPLPEQGLLARLRQALALG